MHDIIVPAGSSKFFRKELHFIDGDTDYLVLEDSKKKAETAEKKAEKKEVAEKKNKKADKKADSENKAKKEPAKVK